MLFKMEVAITISPIEESISKMEGVATKSNEPACETQDNVDIELLQDELEFFQLNEDFSKTRQKFGVN